MNNLKINDEIHFVCNRVWYRGVVNLILPDGRVRINSLIGEVRRYSSEVIKLDEQL